MFFDHYPYTNFHNVNLDWVLQAVKAWGQTVEANDRAFRDLKEANEDFKLYVTNYLRDLDITDEINTKLDNMLASGILTPHFAPYVKGYVDNWLASHVTPTSPALDSTLTLSGAAARADSTGKRLKDLAYVDALSTPEVIASLNRSQVLPGYRVQGIAYDYNGHYYVCGGSVDETGTGVIVKMTKPDFTDAEIIEIPLLGHANDITYYNGYLYVCTVGGGDAPQWGIYKINVNDFSDKTLISNAPENTIGISYRQGDFWLLAPYRIYRTTDFTSYEVVVANTNDLLTAYGIPTEGRLSQTLFRAAGYLIGWVCSFVFEDRHYGALTFFNSTGEPVAFKMFPAYHSEIQCAVYADMSIYLLADGNMINVFRMDPRHLSYVQLKAGDDLNSFTGRGTLYSTGSNVSAELLNSPSAGEGFTVQVDRLGVYNTIQTARTNSGRELYRIKSFNNDTWGEWIEPAAEVAQIKDKAQMLDMPAITWDENSDGYYIDATGKVVHNELANHYSNLYVLPSGTYKIAYNIEAGGTANTRVHAYSGNDIWIKQLAFFRNEASGAYTHEFTVDNDAIKGIRISTATRTQIQKIELTSLTDAVTNLDKNLCQFKYGFNLGSVSLTTANAVCKCVESYLRHNSDFIYGQNGTATKWNENGFIDETTGKYRIDCSTLALLVVMGVDYDHSLYNLHNTQNVIGAMQYGFNPFWGRTYPWDAHDLYGTYTYQMVYEYAKMGFCVDIINRDFSGAQVGDLIFWGNTTQYGSTDRYRSIHHVDVVVGRIGEKDVLLANAGQVPINVYKGSTRGSGDNACILARLPLGAAPSNTLNVISEHYSEPISAKTYSVTGFNTRCTPVAYKINITQSDDNASITLRDTALMCSESTNAGFKGKTYDLVGTCITNGAPSEITVSANGAVINDVCINYPAALVETR